MDGLLAAPFDGSVDAEQVVAGFSDRWTRRLVDAVELVEKPSVRSGHVVLAPRPVARGRRCSSSCTSGSCWTGPTWRCTSAGRRRLLATLVEALLAWIVDPGEEARLPRRLHDLVELAEAELPPATPDRLARARGRAIVDFVAALTDQQAVALLDALSGRSGQLWTDAFVL